MDVTIEEAIERMKRVWGQLRDKVIKLGMQIRKIFHDIFGQEEVSIDLPKSCRRQKRRFHRKEKLSVHYHYIPTVRRNLPYMRRSY